jgi:hypothetical protein
MLCTRAPRRCRHHVLRPSIRPTPGIGQAVAFGGEAVRRIPCLHGGNGIHAGPKWETTLPLTRSSTSAGTNQDETPGPLQWLAKLPPACREPPFPLDGSLSGCFFSSPCRLLIDRFVGPGTRLPPGVRPAARRRRIMIARPVCTVSVKSPSDAGATAADRKRMTASSESVGRRLSVSARP